VAAKAQCDGAVILIGEEVQKMLVPDRCCAASAVNEQQRHGMPFGGRPLVDHFAHGPPFRSVTVFPRIFSGARHLTSSICRFARCSPPFSVIVRTIDSELRLVAALRGYGSGAGRVAAVDRRGGCAPRRAATICSSWCGESFFVAAGRLLQQSRCSRPRLQRPID
jgi:hypothetical protein